MSINAAYQTSDIMQYSMNKKIIMYSSCVNAIATSCLCSKHLYNLGGHNNLT